MSVNRFPPQEPPTPVMGGGIAQFPGVGRRFAVFTSSGTFVHPDGASATDPKVVDVLVASGGGGGGSGAAAYNSTTAQLATGGGGGGAGGVYQFTTMVTGSVAVEIGAGGIGGAARTRTSNGIAAGNGGGSGGTSGIGSNGEPGRFFLAGGSGGGGASNVASVGGAGAVLPIYNASASNITFPAGGANGVVGAAGNTVLPGSPFPAPGGTGGQSCNPSPFGTTTAQTLGGFGLGGAGGAGANGSGATASAGQNATGFMAGGGGGGAATGTSGTITSGAGGNGAPGFVIIYY